MVPIRVFATHIVVMVPYHIQKVVKCRMDDRLDNAKADLAVRNMQGGTNLIRELHCLYIMKEASNGECDAINREVSMRSLLRQVWGIWVTLQPSPNRLVTARVECLWKPRLSP
jgi:hypothetical protein